MSQEAHGHTHPAGQRYVTQSHRLSTTGLLSRVSMTCWARCFVRLRSQNQSATEIKRRTITRETTIATASLDVVLLFALRTLRE
jgi:hypothetical protein